MESIPADARYRPSDYELANVRPETPFVSSYAAGRGSFSRIGRACCSTAAVVTASLREIEHAAAERGETPH
jgi:hypothetical protein